MTAVVLLVAAMPAQATDDPAKARLKLLVPDEAFVFVAGEKMTSTGGERLLESPLLRKGKKYTYEVSVIHDGGVAVRVVPFEAGETVEVDFREEFRKVTVAPPARKPIRPVWLPGRVWRA